MLHQITRVLTYRASHPVIRKHFPDCRQQNGVIVQYQYRIGPYGNPAPAALRHRFLCHSQRKTDSDRLPNPFRLATSILPSNNPTRPFTIESPSPTPSSAIALGSLSNAVKMRVCSSSSIPVPVSSTISVNTPWSNCVRTVTLPRSVNLIALDNKLLPICIILSLSPITTASPALSTFSKRFFLPPAA